MFSFLRYAVKDIRPYCQILRADAKPAGSQHGITISNHKCTPVINEIWLRIPKHPELIYVIQHCQTDGLCISSEEIQLTA